jgi:hypothetical protein
VEKIYADMSLPNQKNDLVKNNYFGQVKKIKKVFNNVEENSNAQQVLKKDFINIENYNAKGYLTEQELLSENTSPGVTAFEYNNKDLIIAKIALKDSSIISRFTYDKLLTGGIQKIEIQESDLSKMTVTYNNDDMIEIKSESKSDKKTDISTFKNKYDQFNNIVSTDAYKDGILTSTTRYEYNERNICIKTTNLDGKGAIQWTFDVKLDNNNRTIETNKIDADKNVQKIVIENFDSKNNPIAYKIYINGKLKKVVEFEIEYY